MMKRLMILCLFSICAQRPVRAGDNALSEAESREGYRLLFDGTLGSFRSNWVDYAKGDSAHTGLDTAWTADSLEPLGVCIRLRSGVAPDIRSVRKYKDFELRFKFRINGNQGVFYRATLHYDHIGSSGVEYSINEVSSLTQDLSGAAYNLYGIHDISNYRTSGTGLWNEGRIIVKEDSVEHWLNGSKVVGYRYHSPDFWSNYNAYGTWKTDKTLTNAIAGREDVGTGYITEGYLGLQGDHGGKWLIKDLKVTETPCFGPIKEDGSVCPVSTGARGIRAEKGTLAYTVVRQGSAAVALDFDIQTVLGATLLGLDGKVLSRASLFEGGRKAVFTARLRTGLYILKLDLASGTVTRKTNLL
ncbi:MAG: hypothetical protein JWP91_2913 [Fibrobacteres bacterium]|nr:hypothetical protein [Fibrobacterota bacterium]